MIVNRASISAVFRNLNTAFNKAFEEADPQWSKIAMRVPSQTKTEQYTWFSEFPTMRKWVGDKVLKNLEAYTYSLTNEDYEATVEVDRNDIDDDTLGIYGPQAQMAGESAAYWPDEMIFTLVNNGFTQECYDNQYFFDDDHPVAGASVSNVGTAALTVATQAGAIASFGAAKTAMMSYTNDEGRPLKITPNLLAVPPALMDVAMVLKVNERLEDGKPNPYRGTFDVLVSPNITSSTAWFLMDTRRPVKPFVFQERQKPKFVQQTDMNAPDVFMRKKFKFGAEARGTAGYGFWQMCYGSTGDG